jgi:hypothetical protein
VWGDALPWARRSWLLKEGGGFHGTRLPNLPVWMARLISFLCEKGWGGVGTCVLGGLHAGQRANAVASVAGKSKSFVFFCRKKKESKKEREKEIEGSRKMELNFFGRARYQIQTSQAGEYSS